MDKINQILKLKKQSVEGALAKQVNALANVVKKIDRLMTEQDRIASNQDARASGIDLVNQASWVEQLNLQVNSAKKTSELLTSEIESSKVKLRELTAKVNMCAKQIESARLSEQRTLYEQQDERRLENWRLENLK